MDRLGSFLRDSRMGLQHVHKTVLHLSRRRERFVEHFRQHAHVSLRKNLVDTARYRANKKPYGADIQFLLRNKRRAAVGWFGIYLQRIREGIDGGTEESTVLLTVAFLLALEFFF